MVKNDLTGKQVNTGAMVQEFEINYYLIRLDFNRLLFMSSTKM